MKNTRKRNCGGALLLLALASIAVFGAAREGHSEHVRALRHTTELDVAVLGGPAVDMWNTDVQHKLIDTGYFSSVSVINVATRTPTFGELLAFDAVLVYSDAPRYQNGTLLGDVLADYVDAGYGVVCAVFSTASIPFGGRFADENYWAIAPSGHTNATPESLGTVYDPSHPIMADVSGFDGGSSSYRTTSPDVAAGALRVADWTDGRPLVATKMIRGTRRADLGFYPPSSDSRFDFWDVSSDGDILMANALIWVTLTVTCVSDGDVNNDGSLTAGDALCCFEISLRDGAVPPACDVPSWDCEVIACDVSCDNTLTAGDALEIFDRSLAGGGPDDCFAQRSGPATSAGGETNAFDVSVKDALSAGNTLTVPVSMEATRGAAAFGFEVHFDSESLRFDGLSISDAAEHWLGLGARELEPGRVRVMGFDAEGLKDRDVSQGNRVTIAQLRFEKLADDAALGSVEWIEQRLDREPGEQREGAGGRVTRLELSRPYPNPLRDVVSADVRVPINEISTVRVAVYDVKGRRVRTLLNRTVSGGIHTVTWDGRTETGKQVSSGIYFMQMRSTELGIVDTKKLVVVK